MTTKLNREWVKTAAIVFLAVMLVLTFFSNTIMNRTLPEVATQGVMSGSITAKVRGTGAVTANGLHEVKADAVREIRTVMVKTGQEVNAGDVLFILGKGDSDELEAAQENLESLQMSYNTTALGYESDDFKKEDKEIEAAKAARDKAKEEVTRLEYSASDKSQVEEKNKAIKELEGKLFNAKVEYEAKLSDYEKDTNVPALETALANAEAELANAQAELESAETVLAAKKTAKKEAEDSRTALPDTATDAEKEAKRIAVENAEGEVDDAQAVVDEKLTNVGNKTLALSTAAANLNANESKKQVDAAEAKVNAIQKQLDTLNKTFSPYITALDAAEKELAAAQSNLDNLEAQKDQKAAAMAKSNSSTYLQLQSQAAQIERARAKVLELSGEEGKQITANVSGTVQSVDCTAGNTVEKDALLCTIEVPDMGYGVSFAVTSEQARRLRVGDTASVSNYYWGKEIIATLTSIKTDPKSPQANKILSFELDGDVDAGSELTISVGQKSATYDTVIPNSSIRSDTNGSFVLKIEAKSSPLGNRYIARRVSVEVLAADDLNSAVTGDLSNGDYVITTSNSPVANGDQVKMADS